MALERDDNLAYKCSCGFITQSTAKFVNHIGNKRIHDKENVHESLGKIDLDTGEIVAPPDKRTKGQRQSDHEPDFLPAFTPPPGSAKVNEEEVEHPEETPTPLPTVPQLQRRGPGRPRKEKPPPAAQTRITDRISEATELRFVPKVYQCNLTMILLQTLHICYNVLRWPRHWTMEDVLDKICFTFLKEHGIEIGVYKIDEAVLGALQGERTEEEVKV